jgi:hypothetical protein
VRPVRAAEHLGEAPDEVSLLAEVVHGQTWARVQKG